MTANLWAHKVDVDGFGALVDRVDPDVLAVQELQVPAAAEVMARYRYHGLVAHHDTLGNGIATRFPATISRLPMTYRSGWSARLDPAGWPGLTVPLEVLCVHFGNPVTFPWRRAVDRRRRQLADLGPASTPAPRALSWSATSTPPPAGRSTERWPSGWVTARSRRAPPHPPGRGTGSGRRCCGSTTPSPAA